MAAATEYNDLCGPAFSTSARHGNVLFYLVGKSNAITIADYNWPWWQNTSSKPGHIATFYVRSSSKFWNPITINIVAFVNKCSIN